MSIEANCAYCGANFMAKHQPRHKTGSFVGYVKCKQCGQGHNICEDCKPRHVKIGGEFPNWFIGLLQCPEPKCSKDGAFS